MTLTGNAGGRFECRWVTLRVEPSCRSGWLGAVGGTTIRCPIAHGEGQVAVTDDSVAARLEDGLVAFRYLADGFRWFKMKVGADLEDDLERARIIREEIGSGLCGGILPASAWRNSSGKCFKLSLPNCGIRACM